MVEFRTLGSIDDFAERTGTDPHSPQTFKHFSEALALGRRVSERYSSTPDVSTVAHFVTSVASRGELSSRHFANSHEGQEIGSWIVDDKEAGFDVAEISVGSVFWVSARRQFDIELSGELSTAMAVERLDMVRLPEPPTIH